MDKLKSLERLEEALARLPSVGKRSAARMAYAMLDFSDEDLVEISESIRDLKTNIRRCKTCGMITESEECSICTDENRDNSLLMVVSYPKDVFTIEKSGAFFGKYHVLNGEISLNKGMKTDHLNLEQLIKRIEDGNIKEIVIATSPTIDGETTALYLAKT